ncbi:hypothetical protein CLK_0138 [Clostridium botulinum A3 str. Loch Maree]|nr:hypothetical protein CLK_0138 [Clostridium botulinum A3 str. Loch Maree]
MALLWETFFKKLLKFYNAIDKDIIRRNFSYASYDELFT